MVMGTVSQFLWQFERELGILRNQSVQIRDSIPGFIPIFYFGATLRAVVSTFKGPSQRVTFVLELNCSPSRAQIGIFLSWFDYRLTEFRL